MTRYQGRRSSVRIQLEVERTARTMPTKGLPKDELTSMIHDVL